MKHKDLYDLKRENFKKESLKHFRFLIDDLEYSDPTFDEYIQPNGTVISDTIEYKNSKKIKTIRIENHYHPVDYGFEFNFWNSLTDLSHSDRDMLEYYLKEEQDVEQSYIEKIARLIKTKHMNKLSEF